jgi:SulP family sulfate permease
MSNPISTTVTGPVKSWRAPAWLEPYVPKSLICLREGYGPQFLVSDILAGLSVGVIALPLAMAFAIGSGPGIKPEQGLYTTIIAGVVIALLGGSRVSVAGLTGAFMPILATIVLKHGYTGLAVASIMAGLILVIMGVAKLGTLIKYIPYPVTTGFTMGIAVIIFSSQIATLLGLSPVDPLGQVLPNFPARFLEQWLTYFYSINTINLATTIMGASAVIALFLLRKYLPRLPGAIFVVAISALLVVIFKMDTNFHIVTIDSKFGGISGQLPVLTLPSLSGTDWKQIALMGRELIPEATALALLAAIQALLCCVVADGMIGGRHKSNCELVAQGVGNIASIAFGGLPATGAIARTIANVKAGGRTPLAAVVHAFAITLALYFILPYAGKVPLCALAAILVMVAWNMSELERFRHLLRAPRSDVIVLLTTLGLTLLADLTTAVGVGMVLAAILFMRRMTEVTNVAGIRDASDDTQGPDLPDVSDPMAISKRVVPAGVEVFEINGPFFFGVADLLKESLRQMEKPPKVFILRMRYANAIDASGLHAIEEFHANCKREGTVMLLSGVHAQPMFAMAKYGLIDRIGEEHMFGDIDDALDGAKRIMESMAKPAPKKPEK